MENFNKVYHEHADYVFDFLNRKLFYKDSDLARDLTQDAMLKVHSNLHKFDGDKSSMRTWVVTIAKNVLIDYSRKRQLNTESMDQFVDDEGRPTFQVESKTTPLSDIVNKQIGEGIQYAFSKLPEHSRRYAELFFNRQLTYDEIATELNEPLGTVKGGIHRTRALLQDLLKFDLS